MKPLYIFDLDGTIALIEHRRHLVAKPTRTFEGLGGAVTVTMDLPRWKPNWRQFYLDCVDDQPNKPVIETMLRLSITSDIWIFSGRSDEVEFETRLWLSNHCFPIDLARPLLRMRRKGDYTPDDVLKEQWLDEMSQEDRERLVAVFEDRSRLVKMWRRNGVPCFQVAEGDF